ncbi:MAG: alcohol dehydrogenase catalytic domain-containing protein [Acidimicrobiales bacterium]|jgi:NADPH:quinone reductase-like Zn-dependent oxidoreductase
MRAVAIEAFGTPVRVLELPTPDPAPGEVLVKIHSASVNGFDLAVAAGMLEGAMEHRFPVVLGKDFAGTVEAAGEGGRRWPAALRTARGPSSGRGDACGRTAARQEGDSLEGHGQGQSQIREVGPPTPVLSWENVSTEPRGTRLNGER